MKRGTQLFMIAVTVWLAFVMFGCTYGQYYAPGSYANQQNNSCERSQK